MNYKKKILRFVKESKEVLLEHYEEEGLSTKALKRAHTLTHKILKTRFENELKQYSNDKKKAYDEFIARKNLDYLRVYIEELLLLDKKEEKIEFYKAVRHHMRTLLNSIYSDVMK